MLKELNHEKSWIIAGISIIILLAFEFLFPATSYSGQVTKLLVVAIISMFVIMKSSDYCINALAKYAHKTGISQYIIGFLIITIGTALPDLSNTIFATLQKNGALVLGNVLGANILATTLVLGITLIVAKKMKVDHKELNETFLTVFIIVIATGLLGLDGELSRIDGAVLLSGFVFFVLRHIHHEAHHGNVKKDVPWKQIWQPMVVFVGTLIALLLAARWFVFSSITLGEAFNIPSFLLGVIFVALGTTIPEITVGVHSALKGLHHIGLGNSVGNVIINLGLVLAVGAIMRPITVDPVSFFTAIAIVLVTLTYIKIIVHQKALTWKHGVVLCTTYVVFVVVQVFTAL